MYFEILIVFVIIYFQGKIYVQTNKQIQLFKEVIPDASLLRITKTLIPTNDLENLPPKIILENLNSYKGQETSGSSFSLDEDMFELTDNEPFHKSYHEEYIVEKTEVNIIEYSGDTNEVFDKVIFTINNYLIRNRGAASDFNLIKDIVERNISAIEEDINITIGIPLYLGLMGTMLGIVIGLFNMPDLSSATDASVKDVTLNEGIGSLIGGVKIAMIASFTGLLLTIHNSGWRFKGSKSYNESRKNELYTFLQIELLPIINQGLASTLDSLQRNLLRFNGDLSSNLKGLSGIFDSNRRAIKEQKELLDSLDKAKVADMTRYNVAVLKQLEVSVLQFEKFNHYLANVNNMVDSSQQIVSKTNEILIRTDNFKTIAENLESKLNQSDKLLLFLSDHFSRLEEHKEFTSNAVADVGFSIKETFDELQKQIQVSSENIKQFTIDETDLLKSTFSANKNSLGNLEHLATLKLDVSQFKNSSASQNERLKQSIEQLNQNMEKSIIILEQIERRNALNNQGITSIVRKFFTTNK